MTVICVDSHLQNCARELCLGLEFIDAFWGAQHGIPCCGRGSAFP